MRHSWSQAPAERTTDMTIKAIRQILKDHSVPHYELNGSIFADSMIGGTELFEEVINVTNMSRAELLRWLGY